MTSKIPEALVEKYLQSFNEKELSLTSLLDLLVDDEESLVSEENSEALKNLHHFVYQLNSSALTYEQGQLANKTKEFLKLMEQSEVNIQDVLLCGQQLIQLLQHP
ncbi:hypothetical protein [Wohlfahrtiimonas larvae]|uniref:HPt domain-containing protein n=1 Tax=Wohlfahrtiimonas larvae TaxID=1157986 RepID=A0ABP9MV64_9GAMM|nr:hypothetical protein [Wohlfahrtiimonas larvae]